MHVRDCTRIRTRKGGATRTLSELLGLSLELLNLTGRDTSELEDKATGGGRLAGIDVPADHDGKVSLALGHFEKVSSTSGGVGAVERTAW